MHAPSTLLKLARRQTINVTADSMVRARPLFEDGALPLVVEPELAGVDAPAWIERHGDALAGWLRATARFCFAASASPTKRRFTARSPPPACA